MRVLVLDNDETFRSGFVGNLRDDGHPVIEWRSPDTLPAIDALLPVDAIVMDYRNYGAAWLGLACAFHRRHPEVPIVLATAHWSPLLERTARRIGMVVRKPIDYDELHQTLHDLARRQVAV
jgi:DNA-binding NtrC family response regulator